MPTARNGEFLSQASIDFWVGARHWSKPKPVKLPGVATLAARAGEAVTTDGRDQGQQQRRGGGADGAGGRARHGELSRGSGERSGWPSHHNLTNHTRNRSSG